VLTRFYKEFDEDGTLRLVREYDNGRLVQEKMFSKDNQTKEANKVPEDTARKLADPQH